MADERLVYIRFFPADWRSDERLRLCSMSARGVWIECLCLMFRSSIPGHLLIEDEIPTDEDLATLVGCSRPVLRAALDELIRRRVCSVTEAGVIVSRRMERDAQRAIINRENGQRGGNPNLRASRNKPSTPSPTNPPASESVNPSVNQPVNHEDKPLVHHSVKGVVNGVDKTRHNTHIQIQIQKPDPELNPGLNLIPISTADPNTPQDPGSHVHAARKRAASAYSPDFLRLWQAFPKGSKYGAYQEFQKLRPDAALLTKMLSALEWQLQQPRWLEEGGKYRPDTERWLKKRRWEDEAFEAPDPTDAAWERVMAGKARLL